MVGVLVAGLLRRLVRVSPVLVPMCARKRASRRLRSDVHAGLSLAAVPVATARAAALRSVRRLATRQRETTVHRLEFADGEVVIAKRCRSERAAVEATVYEQVLPQVSVPTIRYYGK